MKKFKQIYVIEDGDSILGLLGQARILYDQGNGNIQTALLKALEVLQRDPSEGSEEQRREANNLVEMIQREIAEGQHGVTITPR